MCPPQIPVMAYIKQCEEASGLCALAVDLPPHESGQSGSHFSFLQVEGGKW